MYLIFKITVIKKKYFFHSNHYPVTPKKFHSAPLLPNSWQNQKIEILKHCYFDVLSKFGAYIKKKKRKKKVEPAQKNVTTHTRRLGFGMPYIRVFLAERPGL